MKAMILAAGLGTRLKPLTDERPKALVTVGGRTLLEIALLRLRAAGVREAVVNTHHFAEMVERYLRDHDGFGMRVEVSREETLLDTGGGLKKAAAFFLEGAEPGGADEPFFVHNVDVVSTIDLGAMARQHAERGALATLAVQERESARALVFDAEGRLRGRPGEMERAGAAEGAEALGFCGIHVVSPRLFGVMEEVGTFSIIDAYLRLAVEGKIIEGFRADGFYWRDLGRPESLVEAERDLRSGMGVWD
jgi:NDP-sugar pyrophosphorylase family protein